MMWPDVVLGLVLPKLRADTELIAALGGSHIFSAQATRPVRVPSIEWMVLDERYTENHAEAELQLDYWARNPGEAATIERRIIAVLHRETRRAVGDTTTIVRYVEGRTLEAGQPGVIHRALRFAFDPVRRPAGAEDNLTTGV
jgi:hypothetical protein